MACILPKKSLKTNEIILIIETVSNQSPEERVQRLLMHLHQPNPTILNRKDPQILTNDPEKLPIKLFRGILEIQLLKITHILVEISHSDILQFIVIVDMLDSGLATLWVTVYESVRALYIVQTVIVDKARELENVHEHDKAEQGYKVIQQTGLLLVRHTLPIFDS